MIERVNLLSLPGQHSLSLQLPETLHQPKNLFIKCIPQGFRTPTVSVGQRKFYGLLELDTSTTSLL